MKRFMIWLLLMVCAINFCGCSSRVYLQDQSGANYAQLGVYAQEKAYTENVYVLYYQFSDTGYLSTDTRYVAEEQSSKTEYNLINALIQGPSSDMAELRGIINSKTKLLNVTTNRDYIYVTLSKEFLALPDYAGENWQSDPKTAARVYQSRRLAVYAIVNTLTENGVYSRVQIYIDTQGTNNGEKLTRREMGFVGDGKENQLLEPLARSMDVVMTPYNTLSLFMQMLFENKYDTAYELLAKNLSGAEKVPSLSDFISLMSLSTNRITNYKIKSDFNVSSDAMSAVMLLDYTVQMKDGAVYCTDIPVVLRRQNEMWKVPYSILGQYWNTDG